MCPDKQNISKDELAIQTLEKKLTKARKKKNKEKLNAAKPVDVGRGSDIEDEDTPEEDRDVGPLSCSIRSKGPQIVSGAPKKLKSASDVRKHSDITFPTPFQKPTHLASWLITAATPFKSTHFALWLFAAAAPFQKSVHLASWLITATTPFQKPTHFASWLITAATPFQKSTHLVSWRITAATPFFLTVVVPRSVAYPRQEHSHSQSPLRKRQKLPIAKIRCDIKVGNRPKAGDYEEPACNILLDAAYDYSCQICAINPFPNSVEQHEMATSAWKKACSKARKSFEFTARMKMVLTARGSKIRGMVKDTARALVGPIYGFDRTNTPATKVKNHESYLALTKADSFHHKTPETRSQFARHRIIYEILRITFFNDKEDLGAIFPSYFNPVSLVTLATIITAVDFCLKEWSTGEFIKAKFYEKAITIDYTSYLKKIQDWHGLAPETVTKMLTKMHNRLRRDAGASSSTLGGGAAIGLSAAEKELALKELEGHMGDTESEEEGLVYEVWESTGSTMFSSGLSPNSNDDEWSRRSMNSSGTSPRQISVASFFMTAITVDSRPRNNPTHIQGKYTDVRLYINERWHLNAVNQWAKHGSRKVTHDNWRTAVPVMEPGEGAAAPAYHLQDLPKSRKQGEKSSFFNVHRPDLISPLGVCTVARLQSYGRVHQYGSVPVPSAASTNFTRIR
ncbi:hypothetical protein FIBSPDRAFT_891562 [Athelia psychrophila]|uniref:DUF6532 domain-containing protein n=1 Tax=Athelia psychrophila TaxID=1759441 RepID=A0A166JKL4_9AGAM|nr:hypothetical protein FIBSPDRAFT_891562 [Fibularhizoctonia sp. CBS 109695]